MTLGSKPAILIYQKENKNNYKLKLFSKEGRDVWRLYWRWGGAGIPSDTHATTAASYSPCLCNTFLSEQQ